jgi:4-diphosphocytidyl-2C-methyl-D-erythritol kinase
LNLTLAVVGRREDGFHALHSVMAPLSFGDAVSVSAAPVSAAPVSAAPVSAAPVSAVSVSAAPAGAHGTAAADTLRVAGQSVPATPDNLVLLAIAATRAAVRGTWPGATGARTGANPSFAGRGAPGAPIAWPGAPGAPIAWPDAPLDLPPLAARLTKRIPVAAGLGGGSSDAAATVAAALEAWGAELSADAVRSLAASLGSDVPFFLAGGIALVTGRGEFVEALRDLQGEAPAVLLVTPRVAVSTPAVFAAYAGGARPATAALAASESLVDDLRAGLPASALLAMAGELAAANDLLPATLEVVPALAAFRAELSRIVGRPVGQSGSGPTAWVLYPSLATARRAARFVRLAIRDGSLPEIGDGVPFVAVGTILAGEPHAGLGDHHNGVRRISKGR